MEVYKKCPLKKRPIIVNECKNEEPEDLSFKRNHKRDQPSDIKRHFDLSSNSYYDSIRKTNEFGFWYKSIADTLSPDHQLPRTPSGLSNDVQIISAFKTYHNPTQTVVINQQYDTLTNIHLRGLTNLEINNFHYDPYLNSNNLNFYSNELAAEPTAATTEQLNYTKDYVKDYNAYNLTPPSSPASVISSSSSSEPEDLSTRCNGDFLIESLLYSPSSSVSSSKRNNIGNWKNSRLHTKQFNNKKVDQYQHSQPSQIYRFQCDKCQKSYSTSTGLSKHQQLHCPAAECNKIKKEFGCKSCDKVYTSLGALKMHIRTHTLPCKCPHCGKAFSRPWLLQGHIRTHTGEKPFSCSHCQRAFADRSNLRAHQQTHVEVKKYICENCSKSFSRMSLLTKHVAGGCCGIQLQSYI